MITDSEAAQVQAALTALLDTNAPLGVLYTQFLKTKWVAAQLSTDKAITGSGRFLVASAVHCVLDTVDQKESAERRRKEGADQENKGLQQPGFTATSTDPPTESESGKEESWIELRVVSEYILARLYRDVPLELNPFLVHFVRVYVQQPSTVHHGSSGSRGRASIRYLLHRLLSTDSKDSAAGLSSLPVSSVVTLCADTSLDLYGNVIGDNTRKQKQISSGNSSNGSNGSEQEAGRYDDSYLAGFSRSWLTQVLQQQQGLDYTDVLTALRPALECGPVEVLARVSGVLGDAALLSLDFDDGDDHDQLSQGHLKETDTENQKKQKDVFYFEGQPGTTAQRLRALETEGGVLMDVFANAFYAPGGTAASRAAYQTQFDALVSRPEFTSLQAQLLLRLWKTLLQAPSDPSVATNASNNGGVAAAAEDVRDALLDSVCTRLSPHRITNQTADFVYQMVMLAHSHDLAQSNTSGSIASRLVYGSVFRWLEAASASASASSTSITGSGSSSMLDPDLALNLNLNLGMSDSSPFASQLTGSSIPTTNNNNNNAQVNAQVRLICLVLKSLKLNHVLEPSEEYVVLYGQLLPYVSGVAEARELCFPGGFESGGSSGSGSGVGESNGHRMGGGGMTSNGVRGSRGG